MSSPSSRHTSHICNAQNSHRTLLNDATLIREEWDCSGHRLWSGRSAVGLIGGNSLCVRTRLVSSGLHDVSLKVFEEGFGEGARLRVTYSGHVDGGNGEVQSEALDVRRRSSSSTTRYRVSRVNGMRGRRKVGKRERI